VAEKKNHHIPYGGFELGPIRPPSEAYSLLVRVTRNCPWNRCTFCPVYKERKFSRRPTEHVIQDIDLVFKFVENLVGAPGDPTRSSFRKNCKTHPEIKPDEWQAFSSAYNWVFAGGMKSVFLQDADSLVIKPSELVKILRHLKKRFPEIERITSYARSQTVARWNEADLRALRDAGLNRIHIGLESGSDRVLQMVKKGATQDIHVAAGKKVKNVGMELSEYVMPGLGGKKLSRDHARKTADALNQINPDFIRLRTLAIPEQAPLFDQYSAGTFEKCTEQDVVEEILMFIEHLKGITSTLTSDHILNLFQELEGTFPDDKDNMILMLREFLNLDPHTRMLYQVGRRTGILSNLTQLDDPETVDRIKATCRRHAVTLENLDKTMNTLMAQYL